MSKQTEALKLALELIQDYVDEYGPHDKDSSAQYVITAIKEVLANVPASDTSQERVDETAKQRHEPVAWMWRCKPYCDWPEWSVSLKRPADSGRDGHKRTEGYEDVPLYTTPPQRTWQGLTDEEFSAIYSSSGTPAVAMEKVEAKLREKNT